jgi:hypothetical protein
MTFPAQWFHVQNEIHSQSKEICENRRSPMTSQDGAATLRTVRWFTHPLWTRTMTQTNRQTVIHHLKSSLLILTPKTCLIILKTIVRYWWCSLRFEHVLSDDLSCERQTVLFCFTLWTDVQSHWTPHRDIGGDLTISTHMLATGSRCLQECLLTYHSFDSTFLSFTIY